MNSTDVIEEWKIVTGRCALKEKQPDAHFDIQRDRQKKAKIKTRKKHQILKYMRKRNGVN